MNNPPQEAASSRATSSAGNDRSPRDSRRINSQQQISQIEKSVTHLLIATKQLLETLTLWSRNNATEKEVSDVYVRLGYEFNIACRAFAAIGVETKDLGPVPDLLRTILEETLSNDANQTNLDRYLPRIRDIIVGLLQGLKKKQQKLRQRVPRESSSGSSPSEARQDSGSYDGGSSRQSARSSIAGRQDSSNYPVPEGSGLPPRAASTISGRTSPSRSEGPTYDGTHRASSVAGRERPEVVYTPPESTTSNVLPDYPLPMPQTDGATSDRPAISPPPIPSDSSSDYLQPHQQDAIAKLQRGGELERRASRRFSNYQIQKHLGTSSTGIPMVPPTQNSPIPNRGREARESMNAVRVRGGGAAPSREASKSTLLDDDASSIEHKGRSNKAPYDPSPSSSSAIYELGDNESSVTRAATTKESADQSKLLESASLPVDQTKQQISTGIGVSAGNTDQARASSETQQNPETQAALDGMAANGQTDGSNEPKDLTLFLQYKTKIKKFILAGGYEELSIARLQLAFIEKFSWNTHSNGTDLPEIYIQDPVSGVRHELEDLSDVKNHSVLALNVDSLDEVKKHMDDGMGSLTRIVEGVRSAIETQASTLQRMSTKQAEFSKEITRMSSPVSKPLNRMSGASFTGDRTSIRVKTDKNDQLGEVQKLRRDLAVMRQTYTTLVTEVESSMANIHSKAADAIKSAPARGTASDGSPGDDGGRAYVNAGKKSLSEESEKIISRVDDLQDVVEDLRKDVVQRGVRPLPRQLDTVRREILMATNDLKKMQDFIKQEKPKWTDIWKNELQVVCDDQSLLNVQEELAADLEDDLAKANETFSLVEEATKAKNVQNASGAAASRSTSRTLPVNGTDFDPKKAKDGVLDEVRALQPNHESRLEAIERAEKLRERELANRPDGGFKKELGSFVGEGRLKKSGGVQETERQRKIKDEKSRKETWDRMNARAAGIEPQQKAPSLPADADATEVPDKLEIPTHPPTTTTTATTATIQGELRTSSDPEEFVEAREEILVNGEDESEAGGASGSI